ncbi:nucleotide exchange factor GrpE [Niabella ginsengisoli]|uniref:Protein GrpE n=1 Tax=Niabella ginsengisoli TaxID=522298 RepID=A0ABS9SGZ0_9BACT|nr:nucleotide exchange factor GrpE [Niabella ginsengisoli]MCH5597595.1 nucleotide exchange factor GrpE [Niabella ginsengisoli]
MNQNNDKLTEQEGLNINADENLSGTEHLTDPVEETQLDALETELNESKDKYLRLAAEFDNFRRRTKKEREEFSQIANKDIVLALLEVLDDADRATPQIEASEDKKLKEGISLVFNKLRNLLQAKGLKVMEAKGADFDPDLHEAITEIPAPSEEFVGKIVDEVIKGYYLNDKIIRHAKVVVGK